MDRIQFLKSLAILPLAGAALKLNDLTQMTSALPNSPKMPVLFLGHGSPMNAIEENEFVTGFRNVAKTIPHPVAILCVSAHWETRGTFVTAMQNPPTIHDFGGFPKALFDVQYPAPGSPELASEVKQLIQGVDVGMDQSWGLDHGAWSVIKHLYPNADVPVVQLSLDYNMSPEQHYNLAKQLSALRNKGILIVGSGNMVHNLGLLEWSKLSADNYAFDWTIEASSKMKEFILKGDHEQLIHFQKQGRAFQLAIPTPEHYLPMLYMLALQEKNETAMLFNDKAVAGSLTMTSFSIA